MRELLGAHVLGGLEPADRQAVEGHLPGCADCRAELARYAPLPGLLRLAPDPGVGPARDVTEEGPVPRELLEAVRVEVGRRRRRVVVRGLVAAAAAVVLLLAGVVVGQRLDRGAGPDGTAFALVALPGAGGSGAVTDAVGNVLAHARPWGAELSLQVSGLNADGPFSLEVTGPDGRVERAATWGTTPTGHMQLTAATSLAPGEIIALTVLSDGAAVLGSG